jgi:hypothetical protein
MDESRFAVGHNEEGGQYTIYKNTSANAAGGLLTTIEDYCKFAVDVLRGAGLSKQLFNEMIRPQVNIKMRTIQL